MYQNKIMPADGFYVTYNYLDASIYGSDTTALVKGQMEKFFILNGDHRQGYTPLIPLGFDACFNYFRSNITFINKYSDKI